MLLHPDRCFPADEKSRSLARKLYQSVKEKPILSPHGHTEARWFSQNIRFSKPAELLITPDHYVFRMLYSQGIPMESLRPKAQNLSDEEDYQVWKIFCENYFLFRGAPSRLWLDTVFYEIFELKQEVNATNARSNYEAIQAALNSDSFRALNLLEKFKIELLCTTDHATDSLEEHEKIKHLGISSYVIPCFRPDQVLDPEHEFFREGLEELSAMTSEDCFELEGYLRALKERREFFKSLGATSTDHGHPTAKTLSLSSLELSDLFQKVLSPNKTPEDAENFRAAMLFEMARMSLEDGLVMQLHPGSFRNHNQELFLASGRDMGADIPVQMEYTKALKPLLNAFGNDSRFQLILFTLDESCYSRELAPLAGHYPALKLGPPWWFHDSVEGMIRFREQVTETAGFYNLAGFNDDTRAFFSIPARHDLSRRIDARFLAGLVSEHRLRESEAFEVIDFLSYEAVKKAYRIK